MKTLTNGLTVFNATPHPITFWREDWPEPVIVESDEVINAVPVERPVSSAGVGPAGYEDTIWFVMTIFEGNETGEEIIRYAKDCGADVIVGSIIAAQAYPGHVVAMIPASGYERVAPAEKRMRPDKFTIY
jgi:hypothetical protein